MAELLLRSLEPVIINLLLLVFLKMQSVTAKVICQTHGAHELVRYMLLLRQPLFIFLMANYKGLMDNAELKGLLGRTQQMIVSASEVKEQSLDMKSKTERAGSPFSDAIVELDRETSYSSCGGLCAVRETDADSGDSLLELEHHGRANAVLMLKQNFSIGMSASCEGRRLENKRVNELVGSGFFSLACNIAHVERKSSFPVC